MPSPRAFLEGFQIHKNANVAGITIEKVTIKHIVVEQYKRYEFPLTVRVKTTLSKSDVLKNWESYIKGTKIINSKYGNPYSCDIRGCEIQLEVSGIAKNGEKKGNNIYLIKCTGYGDRMYKSKPKK